MKRHTYEWLAGLHEMVIDSKGCPPTFSEYTLRKFKRNREGNWIDETPGGNDHSINAPCHAMTDDILRE